MRYLFVGGPLDGETRAVPDGETTVHARRPSPAVWSFDAVTEPSDDGLVCYRRRGRGHVVAFCDNSQRQDSIHWVAEIAHPGAYDFKRVEGVPYCWSFRAKLAGKYLRIWHVLGDAVDDGKWGEHTMSATEFDQMAPGPDESSQQIARLLVDELAFQRIPGCFVDGCTERGQAGAVDGLWKPRSHPSAPWELLGPVRACPPHWYDILRMPPTFGTWSGTAEADIPAWLRPYLRQDPLNAFDQGIAYLQIPGTEYDVARLRYQHAFSGAWVTAEQYWGLGPPLPTGGKNG